MSDEFSFNPFDDDTRRNPFPLFARARREHPVFPHPGLPIVSVFRYADIQNILRDHETWSNRFPPPPGVDPDLIPPPSMLGQDPPEHTRLRSLVNQAFTPRIIRRLEPRMAEIADQLLDTALAARDVDFVEAFTYPLPVIIIAEIIGVPAADREQFKQWSDEAVANLGNALFAMPSVERLERLGRLLSDMGTYFAALADDRRRHPREDLLTGLVQAEVEGSRLTFDEMIRMLVLLLVAGNETTTTLIGNTVLELVEHPDQLARLRAAPELIAVRGRGGAAPLLAGTDGSAPRHACGRRVRPPARARADRCVLAGVGEPRRGHVRGRRTIRRRARRQPTHRLRIRDALLPRRQSGPARGPGGAAGPAAPHAPLRAHRQRPAAAASQPRVSRRHPSAATPRPGLRRASTNVEARAARQRARSAGARVTRLAIFAAMSWECRPIVESLGAAHRTSIGSVRVWRRAQDDDEIWVVKTGIGIERAARAARSVLDQTRFDLVMSTGCAGALSPDLDVGDLAIASRIVAPHDGTCLETDIAACARARNIAGAAGLHVAVGPVVCSATVLPTAAAKRAVGAAHAAIAVDMESAPIAACAAAQGIPFVSARAILDRVDTELPQASLVAPDGHVRTLALARRVATHPGDLVRLWALRGMTVRAQQTLQTFFAAWIVGDEHAPPTGAPGRAR